MLQNYKKKYETKDFKFNIISHNLFLKKINEKLNLIEYICSSISECYYLGPRIRPNIDYINLLKRIKKKIILIII